MNLMIYGEGRTQIGSCILAKGPIVAGELRWSSPTTIEPLARIQDRQGLCWYKISKNTKINHIMVSFTDYYNVISLDRLPSKTKIRKNSWYFNNSLLCKPEFSSVTRTFLFFLLKTQKKLLFSKWLVALHQISFYRER